MYNFSLKNKNAQYFTTPTSCYQYYYTTIKIETKNYTVLLFEIFYFTVCTLFQKNY
jgi:hypothetical protein